MTVSSSRHRARACLVGVLACLAALYGTAARAGDTDAEVLAARRMQLDQLSTAEREELLQKKRRFDELKPAEQERLRALYREVQSQPDAARLEKTLTNYSQWLKTTLSSTERAQLQSLPATDRVARIKKLLDEQASQRFRQMVDGKLGRSDLQTIHHWLQDYVAAHEKEILESFPGPAPLRPLGQEYDPERRRGALAFWVTRRQWEGPRPGAEERAALVKQLSNEAQTVLVQLSNDAEREKALSLWIEAAADSRRFYVAANLDEMREFVYPRISEADRQRFEDLPRERLFRELQFRYNQLRRSEERASGQRGKGGPSGRSGRGGPFPGFGPRRSGSSPAEDPGRVPQPPGGAPVDEAPPPDKAPDKPPDKAPRPRFWP